MEYGASNTNPCGTPEQCAAAAALITPLLVAQAEEIRVGFWDWHPEASLPEAYMLAAYPDGVWIIDRDAILNRAIRFARVGDSWT